MRQDNYDFITRMLSGMTSISNESNISNDRIKPALTPDMLNFDAMPSREMDHKNTNHQPNNLNSIRKEKNKDYYNNIDESINNKNSSLEETPFEKLSHDLKIKEKNEYTENKSDYAKDLAYKNNINDYKDKYRNDYEKKRFNKNDNDYDNKVSNRNSYYFEKEESKNVTDSDKINQIEESQKKQNEEKKGEIVSNKDLFFDNSDGLKEIQNREKNYTQNYPKKFKHSIDINYSNYNANDKKDDKKLDTFDSDKSNYGYIRGSKLHDVSYSKSSPSSSLSSELSSSSLSSNIKPIPFFTSLISDSHHDFLNRSKLQSHQSIDSVSSSSSSSQDFSLSTISTNKKNLSKFNVVINIDKIEIRSIDKKNITKIKETSSKRYSQSIEEYYTKRFS